MTDHDLRGDARGGAPDDALDDALRAHFRVARARDAQAAPAFEALLAPRIAADRAAPPPTIVIPRWQHLSWVLPLAACLLLLFRLDFSTATADDADAAFEAVVAEWTRTGATATRTPTDALLDGPGTALLRTAPRLPTGELPVTPRDRS